MFSKKLHVGKQVCVRSVRLGRNEAGVLMTSRQLFNSVSAQTGKWIYRRPLPIIHFQCLALFVLKYSRGEHTRSTEAINHIIPHVIVSRSTKSPWVSRCPRFPEIRVTKSMLSW